MAAGSLIGFELSREEGPAYEVLQAPGGGLDQLAADLHARLAATLACQVARLDTSYRTLAVAATVDGSSSSTQGREQALRQAVASYFNSRAADHSDRGSLQLDVAGLPLRRADGGLLQAAKAVVRINREQDGPELTARAVARILHGISSPAFPSDVWCKRMGAFWSSQLAVDFGAVHKAAELALKVTPTV